MAPTRLHPFKYSGRVLKDRLRLLASGWECKYVGVPYLSKGRSRYEGCDCWGLVRLVYSEQFGMDIPSWETSYDSAQDMVTVEGVIRQRKNEFKEVQTPEPGDIVLCRVMGYETHVGIYAGDQRMLHVMKGVNTCIVPLTSKMWRKRVVGYFRHELKPALA